MSIRNPLISAWIGRGNFGDELLAYGLRLELCRAAPVAQIDYHEAGRHPIFRAPDDVRIEALQHTSDGRLRRLWARLRIPHRTHDTLLFGGGSILHSEHSIRWKHALLKRFRARRRAMNSLAGGVGISLGPFPNATAERMAADFVRDLDFLHCRDRSSAEFAGSLGSACTIIEGRDLAYTVKAIHPELFLGQPVPGRTGMSFILDPSLPPAQQQARFERMRAMIDHVTARGNTVLLIALYTASRYHDDRLAESLRTAAAHPDSVSVHAYRGDVFETLEQIASCSHFVSMRLHGAVSAFLSGVPFLPVNKHPKVREFARAAGLNADEPALGLESPREELLEGIDRLLASATLTAGYSADSDGVFGHSVSALRTQFA